MTDQHSDSETHTHGGVVDDFVSQMASAIPSPPTFPMCSYPDPATSTSKENRARMQTAEKLAKLSRFIMSKVYFDYNTDTSAEESVKSMYISYSKMLENISEPLVKWNKTINRFFHELHLFLNVLFTVKQCDKTTCTQGYIETTLGEIISHLGSTHIHAGCPFHLEDNFCHCFTACMRALSLNIDEEFELLCRRGFTALLHDVGKKGCELRNKSGTSVSYPAHGIAGSLTLRHCWNLEFTKWFTAEEWELTCDAVCYHMCGSNSDYSPKKSLAISQLLPAVWPELRALGIADGSGAVPLENFTKTEPTLAMSQEHWDRMIADSEDGLQRFMDEFELNGVLIRLMGGSAQGKSHTIEKMIKDINEKLKAKLLAQGTPEGEIKDCKKIKVIQRDEYLHRCGRKLLGNPSATYGEAYAEVNRVHALHLKEKRTGAAPKRQINFDMADAASKYLRKGYIVFIDTCANLFIGRESVFPLKGSTALRIDIHVARTTCVDESDMKRHDMDKRTQIDMSGDFDITKPFPAGAGGKKMQALRGIRPCWAAWQYEKEIHGKCPHFAQTISTVTHPGCELPNLSLDHLIDRIAALSFEEKVEPDEKFNLTQLMAHLQTKFEAVVDSAAKVESIDDWFGERLYMVSHPMRVYLRRAEYYLAVKEGRVKDAENIRTTIPEHIRVKSDEKIMQMDLAAIKMKVSELTRQSEEVFLIKYLDGINRKWKAPWHIGSRSPVITNLDNVYNVESTTPRGPEAFGDTEHNVFELQDLNLRDPDDLDHFAPSYQTLILAANGDEEAAKKIHRIVCSSKRDGMCFRVRYIKKGTKLWRYWRDLLQEVDDDFINLFLATADEVMNGDLVIPASNGTGLLTFPGVQQWMACSIALSYDVPQARLLEIAKIGNAVDVLMEQDVILRFMKDFSVIAGQRNDVEMHMWEAIGGPLRMCAFDTSPHTELASAYPIEECGVSYLGTAYTDPHGNREWIPHYDVVHNFQEPMFWEFAEVLTTRTFLKDLSRMHSGAMSWEEFSGLYQMGNRDSSRTNRPDPEGLVAYMYIEIPRAVGDQVVEEIRPVYCKAKTWLYYVCHKISPDNIPKIMAVYQKHSKIGDVFPSCRAIHDFFGDTTKIEEMIDELRQAVLSQKMVNAIPHKAQAAFARNPPDVKFKMALNLSKAVWRSLSISIAAKYFRTFVEYDVDTDSGPPTDLLINIREQREHISSALKGVLMKLECWDEDNWKNNLKENLSLSKIAEKGEMSSVGGTLWDMIWKSH